MMIQETLHTMPTESLRFGYTEEQIKARIVENIKRVGEYIVAQESLAHDFAAKSGASDVSIEKIIALAARRHEIPLRWEAEMAIHHAGLARIASSRRRWLSIIKDFGVYINKTADGRVLLLASEVMLLVEPFEPEQLERYTQAPVRGGAGLNTARGAYHRLGPPVVMQEDLSLGDALKGGL